MKNTEMIPSTGSSEGQSEVEREQQEWGTWRQNHLGGKYGRTPALHVILLPRLLIAEQQRLQCAGHAWMLGS